MSDRTCDSCSNPVHNQDTICSACTRKTRRHLANQAAYLADLETELARMSHKQPPSEGGRSAEIPLPYSPIAGDLIAEQRNLLTSWARLCHDEHIIPEMPADTIPSLASWLIVALPVLRKHEAAGEFRAEIRKLSEDIVRCIDSPVNRTKIFVGPCPQRYADEHDNDEPCSGEVDAVVPADERERPLLICRTCRVQWTADQWMHAGNRIKKRADELMRQRDLVLSLTRRMAS